MSSPESDEKENAGPAVTDRWWVDTDRQRQQAARTPPTTSVGRRFFRAGLGYDQDRAHGHLTDLNLKLLQEADPPEGGWSYLQLAENAYPEGKRQEILRMVNLPAYARGAVIDSECSIRLIITGTPVGERILELTLGEEPSFDCWIEAEWQGEEIFADHEDAIQTLRQRIHEYLDPESIRYWRAHRAPV